MKKSLNVDSPSFTPSFLSTTDTATLNGNGKKSTGISPKAANAAPFLPKSATALSKAFPACAAQFVVCCLLIADRIHLRQGPTPLHQNGLWTSKNSSRKTIIHPIS